MNNRLTIRLALSAVGSFVAVLFSQSQAAAQCAMCKNAITGSPDAARLAANFNFAVLVLLIPPVLIFCGIFFAVFKFRKANGDQAFAEHSRTNSLWMRKGKPRINPRDWKLSGSATGTKMDQDKL